MSESGIAGTADRQSFDDLVHPYRRELLAHCYRMLGSVHDADDALQDTLLRAWRGLPGFAGQSSLRTWLYKIATNACLALIERRGRRALPIDVSEHDGQSPERPRWIEPFPAAIDDTSPTSTIERRESVELAFVAAFQHLPANQRAVLLLRDVLDFSAKETAALLDTTTAAVTSSLQRARARIRERRPATSQQSTLKALGDERVRAVVDAYVQAWERRDTQAILTMLTDDATFSMPPAQTWYQGRDTIAEFLVAAPLRYRWRLLPTRANGQLAFGCYECADGGWAAHSLDVVTLRGDRIEHITSFFSPDLVALAGLPSRLTPGRADSSEGS